MTQEEAKKSLEDAGFGHIQFVEIASGNNPGPHTHERDTSQIIMSGELIVEDEHGTRSYKYEDKLNSPAGTSHTTTVGPDGASFMIGTK